MMIVRLLRGAQLLRGSGLSWGLGLVGVMAGGVPAWAQQITVPTAVVQAKAVGASYALDGVIQPVRQSTVSTQASGRIATILVKAGDPIRAGQLLATIDDREALAGVQHSQAQINQADAALRNAQANLERTRELQGKGFVSKAALDTAYAQYQGGLAVREQALAAARQTAISHGFTRVSAPYDGFVLQTHAEAGDLSVLGKPLLTLYAPQPLRAVVQVPGTRAQAARTAAQTLVQVDDVQSRSQWVVPVTRSVLPSADPVSQTTEWRLELPAKGSENLVPGQQVRVHFTQASPGMASQLWLPPAAIVRRGELTAVYLARDGGFTLRAVRLGAEQGADGTSVLAGVAAGDVVALDPIRAGFSGARPANAAK